MSAQEQEFLEYVQSGGQVETTDWMPADWQQAANTRGPIASLPGMVGLGFTVMTGGGPGRSTELFSLYAYVHAFLNLDLGRGSAAAIIGGLIILVIGVVLYRLVDRIAKA